MGLWDSLKAVSNLVTGGGAKVTLEVIAPSVREPIQVTIRAEVGDSDLNVRRVYLMVRAEEDVEIPDVPMADEDGTIIRQELERETETCRLSFDIAGEIELPAGSSHEWQAQIELPVNAQPTYKGRYAEHEWKFFAGLDTFGNDPDSGWMEIIIQ
ncbi:MAG: hypothetical protein HQL54_00975 [Magnetococcales bacterium]|nr:hypothetical protein [Magnetococcales bacterium]